MAAALHIIFIVPWVDFGRVLVEGDVFLKASVSA
jgi:hypothetical protein